MTPECRRGKRAIQLRQETGPPSLSAWHDFYEKLKRTSEPLLRRFHKGPEQASKVQTSHELLCMSLFLKNIQEKERSPGCDLEKKKEHFFNDRIVVICHLCLLLPRKTSIGTISFNAAVITSLWLRELQWTFIGPWWLCTLVNTTHMYTQKAAFAHYGVCTTASAKYLHQIQSFAKKVFIPMLQEGNLSFANHAFQISHSGCQTGREGYSVLPQLSVLACPSRVLH